MVEATARRAAASRDNHLTLRRVERQQRIIELLAAARTRVPLRRLAEEFGVAERTIARDLQRLRHSGVPIEVTPGRHGGATVISAHTIPPVTLDFSEVAAVMARARSPLVAVAGDDLTMLGAITLDALLDRMLGT